MARPALKELDGRKFDVIVIGAGVNGASGAHHLAAAGYSVLVVDKGDFAAGSSSRSSRLLHCGLRFIEPGEGLGYRKPSMWDYFTKPKDTIRNLGRARDAMNVRSQISTSGTTASAPAATRSEAARHPLCSTRIAMNGRNASCPVALPAVRTPTTRPRRCTNHWSATVAANTSAIEPVPRPIMRPQVSTSTHGAVANTLSPAPAATSSSAAVVTRRRPNFAMSAAANGAVVAAMALIAVQQIRYSTLTATRAALVAVTTILVGMLALAVSPAAVGWLAIVVGATSFLPQTVHVLRAPTLDGVSATRSMIARSSWIGRLSPMMP